MTTPAAVATLVTAAIVLPMARSLDEMLQLANTEIHAIIEQLCNREIKKTKARKLLMNMGASWYQAKSLTSKYIVFMQGGELVNSHLDHELSDFNAE